MHRVSRSPAANLYTIVLAWMSAALLLLTPRTSVAQTTQGDSLADMARQVRAQKNGGQTQPDNNRAQQIANQLSEDQSDNSAPAGSKTKQSGKTVNPAAPAQAAPAQVAKPVSDAGEQSAQASAEAISASGQQTGNAPKGFKAHPFQYCKGPQQCWNASVLVPADARLINSTCKQYMFETKIKGNSFLLLVGPEAGDCDGHGGGGPDPVRWKELVDPETKRAPGTYNLISSQGTTLDGKAALISTIGFRKGLDSWMGKRVEVESNGIPLVVGCLAPTDHFSDGDELCSGLINSLQMP
jgi:hypothetical protein